MSEGEIEVYLDNNATTQVLPEVREAMVEALGAGYGNPSSAHEAGERTRRALFQARQEVASLIGAEPESVIFTSGGTEANNLVLRSLLGREVRGARLVTTTVEHSSVLQEAEYLESRGAEVVYLGVDRDGSLSVDQVEAAVTPETTLVSIHWVNNETGVLQPIEQFGRICRDRGVPFHTDGAQAIGKLPFRVESLPIDFLSGTGHKLHGPRGVGLLYARKRRWLRALFHGGSQEGGLRAGTENTPGIIGFGVAASVRGRGLEETMRRVGNLRDRLEERILDGVPNACVNGNPDRRVANTTNLLFPHVDGQALVARLDMDGIRCSQSSACTSSRPEPSYVLRAMGLSEGDAYSSVRFSVSELNTEDDVVLAAERVIAHCCALRKLTGVESSRCA